MRDVYAPAVRFGVWHPIETAATGAPDAAGVLQARADALLVYPKGKSAMVLYDHCGEAETLRGHVAGPGAASLASATALGARWIRYAETRDAGTQFLRLLSTFTERFGAPPRANDRTD